MINADDMLGFLCAMVLHIIGFSCIGSITATRPADTPAALNAVSLELALVAQDSQSGEPASGDDGAAQEPVPPEPPPPEPPPSPEPLPPPEPAPEPAPPPEPAPEAPPPEPEVVLQPEPEPEIVAAPEPEPAPPPEPVQPEPDAPAPEPEPAPPPPAVEAPVALPDPTPPAPAAPGPVTEAPTPQPGLATGGAAQDKVTAPTTGDLTVIKPRYPIGARQRGEEGSVTLDVLVSAEGRAKTVTLVTSSNHPDLDRAAERAVSQAAFVPGTRGGKPVEAPVRLTIIFRLSRN